MKKIFTTLVIVAAILLTLGGCASAPTPTTTPTSLNSSSAEVSKEDQWSDLQQYAQAYIEGEWGGEAVYRPDYKDGEEPYVFVDGDWLHVGDLPQVIPGATLEDTTPAALDRAYQDNLGWAHPMGYFSDIVWSRDYKTEYILIGDSGLVSRYDYARHTYDSDYAVVGAQVYDGDKLDLAHLVEMYRSGAWNGGRIWCANSHQVATLSSRGIDIYNDGWEYTDVFPAVGIDPLSGVFAGYYDETTHLTVAISESGLTLYNTDGSVITSLEIDAYDVEQAFVSGLVEGSDLAFAYGGGTTVYAIDFVKREITPYYQGVTSVWYYGEFSVVVEYDDEDGHHVANRENEVSPQEYDCLPAPARPTESTQTTTPSTEPPLED